MAQKYLQPDKLVILGVGNTKDILAGYDKVPVKFTDFGLGEPQQIPLKLEEQTMDAAQLTLQLSKTEEAFLEEYAERHKVTVAESIDLFVKQLRFAAQYPYRPDNDFEDAVVAGLAEASQCDLIITRNVSDFANSPIAAMTLEEFVKRYVSQNN